MTISREPTSKREWRPANSRCEHDSPMLVVETEAGYYARCIGCLSIGPERSRSEVARKALREQGSRMLCE
jgi:hypothetical protein